MIATRPAFSLPLVVASRLWCLHSFVCACPAAILAHKADTKFDVLKVLRPELWGHGCSALIQLRTVRTYPSFVLPLGHFKVFITLGARKFELVIELYRRSMQCGTPCGQWYVSTILSLS